MWILALLACSSADLATRDAGGALDTGTDGNGLRCVVGTDVGDCAPELSATSADGRRVALSDFTGDVVLIDFSAMWCGPCQEMATTAEDVWEPRQADGFEVYDVLVQDENGDLPSPDDAQAWVDAFGLGYTVLADTDGSTRPDYRPLEALPATWLIGRDGVIVWSDRGGVDEQTLGNAADEAL